MGEDNKSKRIGLSTISEHLGKLPPQAVEIEEAVLGAMMLERDSVGLIIDKITPSMFYTGKHQMVAQAIYDLYKTGDPIDIKTVTHKLRSKGELESAGGAHYVADLTTKVNQAANIEYHAIIIKEQAIKREIIRIGSEVQKEAYEDTSDVWGQVDKLEQFVLDLGDMTISTDYEALSSIVPENIKKIEEGSKNDSDITGIPSGIMKLDKVTAGWQNSDMITIAARPGMGKTAFVITVARNAAIDHKKPVGIFSLEMSKVQLVNRLISAESEILHDKIRRNNLQPYEMNQMIHKCARLAQAPIYIDDTPGLNILQLRAKARRMMMKHGIKMIVIDYLQLMSGVQNQKSSNREQEISAISRQVKGLAKELDIPILALSQLSRAVELRGGDKKPQLSDLRESGSIEQDSDSVIFLYRPEYYGHTQDETGAPLNGIGEIIIAKHRHGDLDEVSARFIGKFMKWTDWEEDSSQFPTMNIPRGGDDFTITLPPQFESRDPTGETKDDDQPF